MLLTDYENQTHLDKDQYLDLFVSEFKKELLEVPEVVEDDVKKHYVKTAYHVINTYIDYIKNILNGDFEVIKVEKEIKESFYIQDIKVDFIVYVDFFIKKDDKYYIFDLKTVKRKWNWKKRKDPKYLNQLYAYKFFICKEYNIKFDDVSCNYLFIDSNLEYEHMEVNCSDKQVGELFDDINKMVVNFYIKKNYVKNPVECSFCSCKKYYNLQKEKKHD